jgi:hypothetical protein
MLSSNCPRVLTTSFRSMLLALRLSGRLGAVLMEA